MKPKIVTTDHPTYSKLEKIKKLMRELEITFKVSEDRIIIVDGNVFGLDEEFVLMDYMPPYENLKFFPPSDEYRVRPRH